VVEAMDYVYHNCPANVHRGIHKLSEEASQLYEDAHAKTAKFINAKSEEIIFTRNATESFNLLMYSMLQSGMIREGDEILATKMEHHANLVPWQMLEKWAGAKLVFADLNQDYTLNMADFKNKISRNTKLVSVTGASNTVASMPPLKEIGKIAHDNGALFAVDGAQLVPHQKTDVRNIGCDFLAFSGHKMLAPNGIGVCYGKKELLEKMLPFLYGGAMIHSVSWHDASWNHLPDKFEAGTPAVADGVGLGAAIDYLDKIGFDFIERQDRELLGYALQRIEEVKDISVHCPKDVKKQASIVLFGHNVLDAHDLALALDEYANIAIRSGMHCAEPIVSSINPNGLDRASFYFYNTKEEIDVFIDALKKITGTFKK
jgi:cysteine desulfurase/selenocysteine lyase